MYTPSDVASRLRLQFLGAFRIELNNLPIRLPTRKMEALFAYLVLHPDAHAREKLAGLFWGDSSEGEARASLRQALSVLRRRIDKKLILPDRESVQILPAFPIWVDVINFQKLAQRILAETAAGTEPFDYTLYRGELLPDFYDDWVLPLREHYRALYIDVMLRSIEVLRARSEYARAIEYAQQILGTDAANERAHQHLMFCFITMGERGKALQQYAACQRALKDEMDVAPAWETQALYDWIKETATSIPSQAAKITNLPIPISSFVGRRQELIQIKRLVSRMPLVTLTGVGGSGKTRLAIQVATDLIDAYQDGVWWVELAPLSEASLVPFAVARALGLEIDNQQPVIESITHFLRNRQVLLVLDNCEHLIESSAELVATLLYECEELKILATSREALGVLGEQVWLAPTLSIPESDEIKLADLVMQYEAVQLFVERTRSVRSNYELSESDALPVAQICRRLDGIPLAIELAAARMKMMSAQHIAKRLDDQFRLLTGGPRTAEDRHRTLLAAVDWSYALLSEHERLMFKRLSIFAGGWTIGSAEAICSGAGIEAEMVLDLLANLVDKSLISVDERGERYTMLETMKAYGRQKLAEMEEEDWIRQKFLDYFLALAETADQKIRGPEQLVWLDRLNQERDNFNRAVGRSINHTASLDKSIQLVCALAYYWGVLGDVNAARYWLREALAASERLGRTAARAKILFAICFWSALYLYVLSPVDNRALLEESLSIWLELGPDYRVEKAKSLLALSFICQKYFDDDQSFDLLDESIEIFRAEDETWWQAWAMNMAVIMRPGAPPEEIRRLLREREPFLNELGDRITSATYLLGWGRLALFVEEDYINAEKYFLESGKLFEELGAREFLFLIFRDLGCVNRGLNYYDRAEWYHQKTIPQIQATGMDYKYSSTYMGLGFIALHKNDLHQAEKYLFRSFKVSLKMDIQVRILLCIGGFAAIEVLRGNFTRAARLFGAYSTHYAAYRRQPDLYVVDCPANLEDIDHFLEFCRKQMEDGAFQLAWNSGSVLPLDEVLEELSSIVIQTEEGDSVL